MTLSLQLTIADVALLVSIPEGVEIVESDACYEAFLGSLGRRPSFLSVPLRLSFDEPADPGRYRKVFDTQTSWKAYRGDGMTVLTMPVPWDPDRHVWTVHLKDRCSESTLYWSTEFVRRTGDRVELDNPLYYPIDQILIMHLLARRNGLIVHSAGFHRDGVGAFFAGVSGAGKSTLTELLAGRPDLSPLSDDRTIVRRVGEGIRVFGTPWPGEAGVAANESAELGAMVFLRQADSHGIRELDTGEALKVLLPTASVLWYDTELVDGALSWCDELLNEVPAYELSFARDEGVVEVVDELFRKLV